MAAFITAFPVVLFVEFQLAKAGRFDGSSEPKFFGVLWWLGCCLRHVPTQQLIKRDIVWLPSTLKCKKSTMRSVLQNQNRKRQTDNQVFKQKRHFSPCLNYIQEANSYLFTTCHSASIGDVIIMMSGFVCRCDVSVNHHVRNAVWQFRVVTLTKKDISWVLYVCRKRNN